MYATQLCKRSKPTCCQINYKSKFVRRGEARRGEARRGEARRGEARRGEARRGEARRGEARRGEARRGEARRGDAIQDVRSHNDLPFNVIHFVGRTISMVI